jgi:hypothetical protein
MRVGRHRAREHAIAGVAIDLKGTREAGEMGDRPLRLAIRGVDIDHAGRVGASPGTIVARIGPQLAGLVLPASGIEHRRRRLVGEQLGRALESGEQTLVHRPQQEGGAADPIGQGRAIERDALPRIDLSLPI